MASDTASPRRPGGVAAKAAHMVGAEELVVLLIDDVVDRRLICQEESGAFEQVCDGISDHLPASEFADNRPVQLSRQPSNGIGF